MLKTFVSWKHVSRKHVSRKHVSRKHVSRKHASSANKSTANKYWSRILMRALARQWEFHEKREKWKIEKNHCPGSNGRRHHSEPGALPTELYWISCSLGLETRFIRCRVIIRSEKRRTVTTVGFEPATLKSDPFPATRGTSPWARVNALWAVVLSSLECGSGGSSSSSV